MYTFHWSDYFVFSILLLFYVVVGIFFKIKYDSILRTNRDASKEYFLANRSMGLLPVTASILVSFMSAISILGTVAEVYMSGIEYAIIGFAYLFAFPLAAFVYLPTFYKLQVSTVHEYLQLRFSKEVRVSVSLVFITQMIFYMAVVLYAPSLVFSQVSGLPLWISILSTGTVCTFYTAMGGMRAVIWTDAIQFIVMTIGMVTVIIIGTISNGGPTATWNMAVMGGRINLFDFNPDPFTRHTFWSLLIGGAGMCLSIYATNQAQVQRYLSCDSQKTARNALLLNIPVTFVFLWMLIGAGLVVYASFAQCDPLQTREISKSDQIFPYLVMKVMHQYSPLPGLFLSTIFAAALSTVSSGINSLSNVVLDDVWLMWRKREESVLTHKPGRIALYVRLIAVGIGLLTIGLAFLFALLSSTVLQIALSLFGMLGGPVLAVFTMGLVVPCVNSIGALLGLGTSLAVTLTLGLGAIFSAYPGGGSQLPRNTTGCSNLTTVYSVVDTTKATATFSLFNLSYLYYTLVAVLFCSVFSVVGSAMTGFNTNRRISRILVHSGVLDLSRHYPDSWPNQIKQAWEEKEDELHNQNQATSESALAHGNGCLEATSLLEKGNGEGCSNIRL